MDIGTAFLLGILVGQWVLIFAIWRGVTKLLKLITELESTSQAQAQIMEMQSNLPQRYRSRNDFRKGEICQHYSDLFGLKS